MTLWTDTDLRHAVARWRVLGRRIVLTNGCFDILHAGHVHLLEEAAAQGDRLIVALNDDDSVRRLKGAPRPVNTLADRARVIGALRVVHAVVAFAEDTPARLIEQVRPDVLVKGGDYAPQDVVGAENSGRVHIVDLLPGRSTTGLLKNSTKS